MVATFLAAAASAPALLSLDGEAGIGKTTLCRCCLERALARWLAGRDARHTAYYVALAE